MMEIVGGIMMMAGGGMMSTCGVLLVRTQPRAPVGHVGVALDRAWPADGLSPPDDLTALLDRIP